MLFSEESSYRVKLVALIVLLPLALAVCGAWQAWRVVPLRSGLAGYDAVSSHESARAAESRKNGPVDGPGAGMARTTRTRLIQQEYATLGLGVLSAATLAFGLSAAVAGAAGLLSIRHAGRRALHSREALLHGFRRGLKKLPWLIGAVGLLAALALACGLGYELINFLVYSSAGSRNSAQLIGWGAVVIFLLLLYGFKLIGNIIRASRAVFDAEPMPLTGKSVGEGEAPQVWHFVRSVAEKAGTVMPDAIVLGLDQGFFVTEHPVEFSTGEPAPQGRVLYLSLPYMIYMSREEAAAVIGHELGHFTGADTEYSLFFAPIYARAVDNLNAVAEAASTGQSVLVTAVAAPAQLLGEFYLNAFHLAVRHWSRERELAADRVGAAAGGSEAVALSLLRISVLAPVVDQALAECWTKGGLPAGGIMARVRQLARENGLGDPSDFLEEGQAHPTDTHPATRQRLESVGAALTPALLARARDAHESPLLRELGLEAG